MKFLGYQFLKSKVAATPTKLQRKSTSIIKTPIDRIAMQMDTLKQAVDSAIDIYNPDRRDLIAIYENCEKDSHVISQLEIAYNKVISQPFSISRNGNDDPEATALLKKEWFEDFQKLCITPEFWGYTLIEFGLIDNNGEFTEVDVFPRRNVLPFSYTICFDANSPSGDGIKYETADAAGSNSIDLKKELFLVELGKADKLGKLESIAREVIWKNFANTDWSQGSEKFGMPLLDIATDSDDPVELNRIEVMAKNFSNNGYVVRGTSDQVNIIQAAGRDFYMIYKEKVLLCDDAISKCINGSTGSSDQQAYVGAAEVHERTTAEFHHARMRRITNIVNGKLLPFLIFHGYKLDGCTFRYTSLDAQTINSNIDQTPEPGTSPISNPSAIPSKKAQAALLPW